MKKYLKLISFSLLAALASSSWAANESKIGFVNTIEIFEKHPKKEAFQKDLAKEISALIAKQTKDVEERTAKITEKIKHLEDQVKAKKITRDNALKEHQEIAKEDKELELKKHEYKISLEMLDLEKRKTFLSLIQKQIVDEAKKKGYDAVIESSSAVFFDPNLDITPIILESLYKK